MTTKDDKNSKKGWDDLVFGAIEKIAAAPGKLRDPKESVREAFDWVKTIRDEVQEKIFSDVSQKLAEIDWEAMSKRVSEHLAENYDIEVTAKVTMKRKKEAPKKTASGDVDAEESK